MGNTLYCLCCNEEVPFHFVERYSQRETVCTFCGFVLDTHEPVKTAVPSEEGITLIADDSKYTRRIIEDIVRNRKISSGVLHFENGIGLVTEYSKLLAEKKKIDLAIVDLNMPVMDGLTAARTMRALETQNNAARAPIVFFSGKKADEDLRKHMQNLEPANYVNKGSDPDPDKLASRVEYLLDYIKGCKTH